VAALTALPSSAAPSLEATPSPSPAPTQVAEPPISPAPGAAEPSSSPTTPLPTTASPLSARVNATGGASADASLSKKCKIFTIECWLFYVLVAAAALLVVMLILFLVWRRKQRLERLAELQRAAAEADAAVRDALEGMDDGQDKNPLSFDDEDLGDEPQFQPRRLQSRGFMSRAVAQLHDAEDEEQIDWDDAEEDEKQAARSRSDSVFGLRPRTAPETEIVVGGSDDEEEFPAAPPARRRSSIAWVNEEGTSDDDCIADDVKEAGWIDEGESTGAAVAPPAPEPTVEEREWLDEHGWLGAGSNAPEAVARREKVKERVLAKFRALEAARTMSKHLREAAKDIKEQNVMEKRVQIEQMRTNAEAKRLQQKASRLAEAERLGAAKLAEMRRIEIDKARVEAEMIKKRIVINLERSRDTSLQEDDERIVQRHFALVDENSTGALDRKQFLGFYTAIGGSVPMLSQRQVFGVFEVLSGDAAHDALVTFYDFTHVYHRLVEAELAARDSRKFEKLCPDVKPFGTMETKRQLQAGVLPSSASVFINPLSAAAAPVAAMSEDAFAATLKSESFGPRCHTAAREERAPDSRVGDDGDGDGARVDPFNATFSIGDLLPIGADEDAIFIDDTDDEGDAVADDEAPAAPPRRVSLAAAAPVRRRASVTKTIRRHQSTVSFIGSDGRPGSVGTASVSRPDSSASRPASLEDDHKGNVRLGRESEVLRRSAARRLKAGGVSSVDEAERTILQGHFASLGRATIDATEFAELYKSIGGTILTDSQCTALFDDATDGKETVDFDGFCTVYERVAERELKTVSPDEYAMLQQRRASLGAFGGGTCRPPVRRASSVASSGGGVGSVDEVDVDEIQDNSATRTTPPPDVGRFAKAAAAVVEHNKCMEDAEYAEMVAELAALRKDRDEKTELRIKAVEERMKSKQEALEKAREHARSIKAAAEEMKNVELARKKSLIDAMKDAASRKKDVITAEKDAKAAAAAAMKQSEEKRKEATRVKQESETLRRRAQIRIKKGMSDTKVSDEETVILQRHFSLVDEDGSGEIDKEEFSSFYRNIGGTILTKKDLSDLFDELDADGGGSLSFDEFVKVYSKMMEAEMAKQSQGTGLQRHRSVFQRRASQAATLLNLTRSRGKDDDADDDA